MEADIPALTRSLLIFLHLVALALAAVAIAFGDYAIFRGQDIDHALLEKSGRSVAYTLLTLWATGLGILALDARIGGFASIVESPKLLAKLSVVAALTANGWLLHRFALKSIGRPSDNPWADARLAAILGAVSAVSWSYALFLGVAKAWSPLLGYGGFLGGYAFALAAGAAVSLGWVQPLLLAKSPDGSLAAAVPPQMVDGTDAI